ncbi:PTS fructose transporter subunit IIBC [Natronospirillum operosum]|uniref:protein-N(pi)-phosphohistidine--D-fructose phosphotransferase n=1 Tax=Natronospirillum operosum TaxID=2759953 RepID=A0A4Z0W9W4_9GAMM|nr:fructose-specific PTS transporter subunit EIIC [Natronospirillum operosum]TGG91307.1 PTS fructose transporter subunit IIBC [Natronospirillum operosum]
MANIVAITSCPTGIAHTFMAASALEKTAQAQGHTIKVETQGSVGAKNQLTEEDIAAADLVIIAADTHVEMTRFAGKKVYETSTGEAVKNTAAVIERALAEASVQGGDAQQGSLADEVSAIKADRKASMGGPYKHLLTGVSYMLPMVVAGGLMIALSFMFGITAFEEEGTLAWALMEIGGGAAFHLMIAVLAGYISFSIADRAGLAPGLIGGMLATNLEAGFLGGIVAGFLAGYTTKLIIDNIRLPESLAGLMPVLVVPLLSSLVVGLLMIFVIGGPVGWLNAAMADFLQGLTGANVLLLGVIIGGMMAIDMGGPINKAAYTVSVGLLAEGISGPMAAAMAAGMTPPLGIALATFVARQKFNAAEREAGKAAGVLGLCFITEGAIPFAVKDPLRVIPSLMIGSAVAGALALGFGSTLAAPHGGIFVLAIPNAVGNLGMYAVSILAGTVVTAVALIVLKRPIEEVSAGSRATKAGATKAETA